MIIDTSTILEDNITVLVHIINILITKLVQLRILIIYTCPET